MKTHKLQFGDIVKVDKYTVHVYGNVHLQAILDILGVDTPLDILVTTETYEATIPYTVFEAREKYRHE